jgi:hypothetical protein
MTGPAQAVPPIATPGANSPMPTQPAQPAAVGGCANTLPPGALSVEPAAAKKSARKKIAKVLPKKGKGKRAAAAAAPEPEQEPWPSGVSEQNQDQTGQPAQGAWPSGISEK